MYLRIRHENGSWVVIKATCSEGSFTQPCHHIESTIYLVEFPLTVKSRIIDILSFSLDFRGLCCRRQSLCKELQKAYIPKQCSGHYAPV